MTSDDIRQSFLDFFKKRAHEIVASSSLIPADPTALFTSAGMQQFVPYLSGEVDPPYKRACSVQKCFRTSDIDKVGNEFHHTYFEMLGNWSFGDYFKEQAIEWAMELLVDVYHLPKDKLWITVFKGEKGIPLDKQAIKIWQKNNIDKKRIKKFDLKDNFWGPVGSTGPCGPCTEIHYDRGKEFQKTKCSKSGCGPNCRCGRFVEVWNLVFMEYNRKIKNQKSKIKNYEYVKLPVQNVDTGAGLERLAAVLQNKVSDYETDIFAPIMKEINKHSNPEDTQEHVRATRIIADHIRAACFLIADGVLPSKEDRGYVLRRLLRRAMRYSRVLNAEVNFLTSLSRVVVDLYKHIYPELDRQQNDILTIIQNEEEKFRINLRAGLKRFKKLVLLAKAENKKVLDSKKTFQLYDTYGFPFELTKEMAEEQGFAVDQAGFKKEFERHRKISRAGVKKKFGGVGEWGEKAAPQHTATHLLHQALRDVLGSRVQQAGSDLTPERLRFDFTYPQGLTQKQIKKLEQIVNSKIKQELKVTIKEMPFDKAIKSGALAFFKEKYPKIVKVYSVGDYSKEVCGGPHVKNTREIKSFKIIKEQSGGAGVRRIRAITQEHKNTRT